MLFTSSRRKHRRKFSYKSKNSRFNTVNSYVNSSRSNNPNTSNTDNFIVNSNPSNINVQNESSFNTLINLQTKTDTESIIIINNEKIDEKNISEEILSHQNYAGVIDYTCDDNIIILLHTEE